MIDGLVGAHFVYFLKMNRKEKKVEITSESIRKWKEQKEQSKRINMPSDKEEPNKVDFVQTVESIAKELNIALDCQSIEKIALQHPALATSSAFQEVLRHFCSLIKPHFKSNNSQQLLQLFSAYCSQINRTIQQLSKQRKGVIVSLEPACIKDNPQDNIEKQKSWHYNLLIRDKQQDYEKKRNFKMYYQQYLKDEKEALDFQLQSHSNKIKQDIVRQTFLPYYNRKMEEISRSVSDTEKKYQKQIVNLFKTAAESNQLEREKMKALRRRRVQDCLRGKEELCEAMGNSLGHFISLNDLFSYK